MVNVRLVARLQIGWCKVVARGEKVVCQSFNVRECTHLHMIDSANSLINSGKIEPRL